MDARPRDSLYEKLIKARLVLDIGEEATLDEIKNRSKSLLESGTLIRYMAKAIYTMRSPVLLSNHTK
jgi:hypothetical protein